MATHVASALLCASDINRGNVSSIAEYVAAVTASSLLSCGASHPRFATEYEPDFSSRVMTASVLGVYQNSSWSDEAWNALADSRGVLHDSTCAPGSGTELKAANRDAFAAMEAAGEAHGVGEALLHMIAPAAQGELILVFHVYGESAASATEPAAASRILLAHGGGPMGSDASPRFRASSHSGLEVTGSFYSVVRRRVVAVLSMEYGGTDLDDALERFARRLSSALPHVRCAGWNWRGLSVVHERDAVGLPLRRFSLVPGSP